MSTPSEYTTSVLSAAFSVSARRANVELKDVNDVAMHVLHEALQVLSASFAIDRLTIERPVVQRSSVDRLAAILRCRVCRDVGSLRLSQWPLERGTDSAVLFRQLLPLQRLRVLSLERCEMTGAALVPLAALVHGGTLEHLYLAHNGLCAGVDAPYGIPPLPQYVHEVAQPIADDDSVSSDVAAVDKVVPPPLAVVRPPDELVLALAQVFSGHWTLPPVISGKTMARPALTFCSALASPYCRLTRLDVSFCCLTDDFGVALAAALSTNSSLLFLDASHNRLTGVFAGTVAQSLGSNSTIKELRIGFQPLGVQGVRAILQVGWE
jgi:hypothetical protein